jgi:hypothetical protein
MKLEVSKCERLERQTVIDSIPAFFVFFCRERRLNLAKAKDQAAIQRDGAGYQPFHCGFGRWPVVGDCQRWTRCNVLFHLPTPI